MSQLEHLLTVLNGKEYNKYIEDDTVDVELNNENAHCWFIFDKKTEKLLEIQLGANFYSE